MIKQLQVFCGAMLMVCAATAEAAPINYDCDTAAGGYSMIDFVQPGPTYQVRGKLTPVQYRKHAQWEPMATVSVQDGASKDDWVSFYVMKMAQAKDAVLFINVSRRGKGRPQPVRAVRLGSTVPFHLTVGPESTVVRLGEQTVNVDFGAGPGAKVRISCSTGQFRFEELAWEPGVPPEAQP